METSSNTLPHPKTALDLLPLEENPFVRGPLLNHGQLGRRPPAGTDDESSLSSWAV